MTDILTDDQAEGLLTEEQAAELIQMSESWLRQRRYAGTGPRYHKLPGSRKIRYDRQEVLAWAKSGGHSSRQNTSDQGDLSGEEE